ncbi:MAG TPA: type II toxin-antitoxin system Phd/YefM family antitoxin [Candidatus Saccharimonadales bacterium]|nr:type II toxin-antitoxin system Phd/YefM family antitoxin [Candidatus Saccharimonadales bacterium]
MTSVGMTEARDELAELVNRATYGGERVIITRRGKPLAAIISAEDLAFFKELEDANDVRAIEAAMAEGGEPIPLEQVKRELGL